MRSTSGLGAAVEKLTVSEPSSFFVAIWLGWNTNASASRAAPTSNLSTTSSGGY